MVYKREGDHAKRADEKSLCISLILWDIESHFFESHFFIKHKRSAQCKTVMRSL